MKDKHVQIYNFEAISLSVKHFIVAKNAGEEFYVKPPNLQIGKKKDGFPW